MKIEAILGGAGIYNNEKVECMDATKSSWIEKKAIKRQCIFKGKMEQLGAYHIPLRIEGHTTIMLRVESQ